MAQCRKAAEPNQCQANALESEAKCGFTSFVAGWRALLSALMVAIWLPASSHALLEFAGLIHARHADHEVGATSSHTHDSGDHDAADGQCLRPASGLSPVPAHPGWMPLWIGLPAQAGAPAPGATAPTPALGARGTVPPEVCRGWQFVVRAAAQVRAPSPGLSS